MGLMQGKVVNRTFCIMDVYALPVKGTETRVNAQDEASGYMISHMEGSKTVRSSLLTLWSYVYHAWTESRTSSSRSIGWRTLSAVSVFAFCSSRLPKLISVCF
jgi:hypothetical protein